MEIKDFIEKFADAIEATNPQSLTPETKFRELEEWSSLSALSAIALADEEYGVEFSGNELRSIETIQQFFDFISSKQ